VVIPIHDENPLRRMPIMTWLLIAINVVVFFTEPVVSQIGSHPATVRSTCQQAAYFDKHAAIPDELVHDRPLSPHRYVVETSAGERSCPVTNEAHKRPYLSVLESMFLHGGWLHILGNMLFLLIFGNNVEDRMGRLKFLVFYLVCGYVAAYGFAFANPHSTETLIGASGAIAGVLGAYLVMFPRARVTSLVPFLFFIPLRLPAWLVLGGWFALQWAYSSGAGVGAGADVAYVAHVFGFVAGAVIALLFRRQLVPPRASPYTKTRAAYY
jgi:membrane associated rhomboid family serine protease